MVEFLAKKIEYAGILIHNLEIVNKTVSSERLLQLTKGLTIYKNFSLLKRSQLPNLK